MSNAKAGHTMEHLTDDQIDNMFSDRYDDPVMESAPDPTIVEDYPRMDVYPLALAQAPASPAPTSGIVGFITRPMGPMPLWAWVLLGGSVAGAGYLLMNKSSSDSSSSDDDDESASKPRVGDVVPNDGSPNEWGPSRSRFAQQLEGYLTKKGHGSSAKVWHDAEDARGAGMTTVSPLINIQIKGDPVKVDVAMQRFCRRDGLNPVQHADGSIGLYPHSGSKRGKEWESYVDALRDDGQTI